ncbi:MAG: hypothetical protein ACU83N_16675 [Gammaproteobacteria bacterium]
MTDRSNRHWVTKILVIGIFIAILVYLFHPGVGQLRLIVNGETMPEPLARLAAIPTLLLVLAVSAVLSLLLFFGVGLFIFLGALFFAFFGLMVVAPYFWPMLIIIFLVIALMAIGNEGKR